MESITERVVAAIRAEGGPLCEACLVAELNADHRLVVEAMSGVAKLDEFQFRTECRRCGQEWPTPSVGTNAAPLPPGAVQRIE